MFRVVIHCKTCTCGQGPDCEYKCAATEKRVYFQSDEKWLVNAAFEKLKDDFMHSVTYLDRQGKTWAQAIGKECTSPSPSPDEDFVDYCITPFEPRDSLFV